MSDNKDKDPDDKQEQDQENKPTKRVPPRGKQFGGRGVEKRGGTK